MSLILLWRSDQNLSGCPEELPGTVLIVNKSHLLFILCKLKRNTTLKTLKYCLVFKKVVVKSVSHQQVVKLLHNKFVVVLGDSIQRSVYKDLVQLLQNDKYLTARQLCSKGELNFEGDCLVEGGTLGPLHNGTEYKEVRQYQSDYHLVRFYFITRIYSAYMRSILSDFRSGSKPDVVIVNSCLWDISRYDSKWLDDYKENLHKFFDELNGILPLGSLVIWNMTMPLAEKIRGGFLVDEIKHKAPHLRADVIEANFFAGTLADGYGLDVIDMHHKFRFSVQHRAKDGVHWNGVAHRRISWVLLLHMAQAWGIKLTCPLITMENNKENERKRKHAELEVSLPPASKQRHVAFMEDFCSDSTTPAFRGFISFEEPWPWTDSNLTRNPEAQRSWVDRHDSHWPRVRRLDRAEERHQYVMRSRHRPHYAPYSYHQRRNYNQHNYYYYY